MSIFIALPKVSYILCSMVTSIHNFNTTDEKVFPTYEKHPNIIFQKPDPNIISINEYDELLSA